MVSDSPPVVAVTGASGYVGTGLLRSLEREQEIERIFALDSRPLSLSFRNVTAQQIDITAMPDATFRDNQVTSVVHLAFQLKPGRGRSAAEQVTQANLKGIEKVLKACEIAKANNLIFLSSHTVYGAHRNNPIPMTEEARTNPHSEFQYAMDKTRCEKVVLEFARENPEITVTILRSCVILGPAADNYVSRALFKPLLLRVLGCNPPLQFVHEDDLSRLLHHLVINPQSGIFNVAGEGVIPYSRVSRIASSRMLTIPAVLAYPLVNLAWMLGLQKDSPAAGLNYVRYPIIMSTGKLKSMVGFRFSHTSEEAVQSYLYGTAQ